MLGRYSIASLCLMAVAGSAAIGPCTVRASQPLSTASLTQEAWGVPKLDNSGDEAPSELETADDILDLDIEQLGKVEIVVSSFDVEVTSVTKTESTVGKSPAAVFVITPEMIRRSSAKSIPELLRMVPGLQVARIDANKWAISARGFNDRYAKKLLVMIDGRSVYTPLFSGVYWDVQDVLLEDIDRIEVIRGPGGTVWGANAVNGVINILTKRANDTQGLLATSIVGSEEKAITGVRYGGTVGSDFSYRIYGKHFERDRGFLAQDASDDWRQGRVGFRADWRLNGNDCDAVTFQGNYYQGKSGMLMVQPSPPPPPLNPEIAQDVRVLGGSFLTRWNHRIDDTSALWLQFYYDRADRHQNVLDEAINTYDLEFGHVFPMGQDHRLTWGLHYRHVHDDLGSNPFNIAFVPDSRRTNRVSAFIQDEITLIDEKLVFTLGSKFSRNDFTGFEYQPSARLLWTIDERQILWGAISRAVRTPSRFDDDARLTMASLSPVSPTTLALHGNRDVDSENLTAFEIGYRAQPADEFSWDAIAFFNSYTDLISSERGVSILPPPTMIFSRVRVNGLDGETYGVELAATYEMSKSWTVRGSYSYLQMQLHANPGISESAEGRSPHNQVYLQSSWDLPREFEFDVIGRYVDNLPSLNVSNYVSLDLRLGWHLENWEFAVVGQSLLEGHRLEFGDPEVCSSEVERGVFAQVVWRH